LSIIQTYSVRTILGVTLLLWVVAGTLGFSREQPQAKFNHSLRLFPEQSSAQKRFVSSTFPETLHVLCAMVEFQTDEDDRTTGIGTFDLSDTLDHIIDPPPHNKTYFDQHLTFAQNYFRKVSDGKLIVIGEVLPTVYQLPHNMEYYSPPRYSGDNTRLGLLMQDSWHTIDSVTHDIDYNRYGAYIIFHAGIGRDLSVDVQELDPTPFDIPSLYLNPTSLERLFGAGYEGVPVINGANGPYHIPNSIILPETESREQSTIVGSYLLQLGINGLLVASIGSYKELPDLFDTKTGHTAIGRFGLMDGQSIFSWLGVFPPEPSAYEKQFLGWVNPITITVTDTTSYVLPAVSLNNTTDSIYKVPISAKEYFLIENRNRDANHDSSTITMMYRGDTLRKTWAHDDQHYNAFNIDSIYGNVIDLDEFDFSLPGFIKEWFEGGVLIWHIDENIIDANIAGDSINANPDRRGVDLEEADGSQDIGQTYDPFTSPGSGSEDGWPFDFWYRGNPAPVRVGANYFSPTTFPNSMSNSGANSHIYIKNFSTRGPRMTMNVQIGDSVLAPLSGFPQSINDKVGSNSITTSDLNNDGSAEMLIGTHNGRVYGWQADGQAISSQFYSSGLLSVYNGAFYTKKFFSKVAVNDLGHNDTLDFLLPTLITSNIGGNLTSYGYLLATLKKQNNDSLADELLFPKDGVGYSSPVTPSIVVSDSFYVGAVNSFIYIYHLVLDTNRVATINTPDTSDVIGVALVKQPSTFVATSSNGTLTLFDQNGIIRYKKLDKIVRSGAVAGTLSSSFQSVITVASFDGVVYAFDENLNSLSGFPLSTNNEIVNSSSIADLDRDGQRDIIAFSGNKIWAINASGALVDNFPIVTPLANAHDSVLSVPIPTVTGFSPIFHHGSTLLTSPIIADIDGNGAQDVIAVNQDGLVLAYDAKGTLINGFPLQAGVNSGSTPAVFYKSSACLSCRDICLAVASDDGHLYAWKTGSIAVGLGQAPVMPWSQYLHDAQNTGHIEDAITSQPRSSEFLPKSLAYNWPNPVGASDNFKTHIRYFVSENATVEIKIVDLAGDLVTTLSATGIGGLDNEIEWDVTNIQSGVYFAHIDAHGATKSGAIVIKIAVVK